MNRTISSLSLAVMLAATGASFAQSEPAPNAHKHNDQKMRECRKAAYDQSLKGEDLRSAIAACAKPNA